MKNARIREYARWRKGASFSDEFQNASALQKYETFFHNEHAVFSQRRSRGVVEVREGRRVSSQPSPLPRDEGMHITCSRVCRVQSRCTPLKALYTVSESRRVAHESVEKRLVLGFIYNCRIYIQYIFDGRTPTLPPSLSPSPRPRLNCTLYT